MPNRTPYHLLQGPCLVLLLLLIQTTTSLAQFKQTPPAEIASKLPVQIPEVATGGAWSDGKKRGTYRAVVIVSQQKDSVSAKVFVQWIEVQETDTPPAILKSIPIPEFNEKNLPNAFLSLEPEQDNDVKLLISGYNPATDEDVEVEIALDGTGGYKIVPNAVGKRPQN